MISLTNARLPALHSFKGITVEAHLLENWNILCFRKIIILNDMALMILMIVVILKLVNDAVNLFHKWQSVEQVLAG